MGEPYTYIIILSTVNMIGCATGVFKSPQAIVFVGGMRMITDVRNK